jgi:hypothetical protein
MDSCFLGPLFFLYSPRDHSHDPFLLAEDGLKDNNLVAANLELIVLLISGLVISWLIHLLSQKPNQLVILYELLD